MEQLQTFLIENQTGLIATSFIILLLLLMGLELIWPRRATDNGFKLRRANNILLFLVNILTVRVLLPYATYEVALIVAEHNVGLLNNVSLSIFQNIVITIIIFDFLNYVKHIIYHKIGFLWRIHRVHHADLEMDVTTGIRFHPVEIILSMLYQLIAVVLVGPLALAIILYEILLSSAALFGHSNILLNNKFDNGLRKLFVTPDMHRIHHSANRNETDSNYGNIFSIWDKLFKTYHAAPEAGYDDMVIGLEQFRSAKSGQFLAILNIPFTSGR